jgi:hypothetical protein
MAALRWQRSCEFHKPCRSLSTEHGLLSIEAITSFAAFRLMASSALWLAPAAQDTAEMVGLQQRRV